MKKLVKFNLILITFLFSSLTHSEPAAPPTDRPVESSANLQKIDSLPKTESISLSPPPLHGQPRPIEVAESSKTVTNMQPQALHEELVAIHDELQKLKPWYTALFPGLFALLGILAGGLISFLIQKSQRFHDTTERLKKSGFEAKLKLIEYRSKQVNEFYGPMLVLLKQSKELSTQLHTQLTKDSPARYIFECDNTSKTGTSLFIHESGKEKKAFRLISELPYLGTNHKAALPRVQVIIDTGERLAKLIEEKSGLVKPSSQKLIGCLGTYLAHLTALRDAYSLTQKTKGTAIRTHDAVFPREIETLTRNDYDDFIKQITEWEDMVDKLLKDKK